MVPMTQNKHASSRELIIFIKDVWQGAAPIILPTTTNLSSRLASLSENRSGGSTVLALITFLFLLSVETSDEV